MSVLNWFLCVLLIVLQNPYNSSPGINYGVEGAQTRDIYTHTVRTTSLIASASCNQSSKAVKRGASLEVVHQYGPCIENLVGQTKGPSPTEMLLRDQSRAQWIQSRRASRLMNSESGLFKDTKTSLPVQSGLSIGTGDYVVKVGLGTPRKDLTLIIDTGSEVTWTQCRPCAGSCYPQKEAVFGPTESSTYKNVSCSSPSCSSIKDSGGSQGCSSSTCVYGVGYGDNSYTIGFLAADKLTITKSDIFANFLFGCGQDNVGIKGQAAGIIGLGTAPLSLPSQTSKKYKKLFSYCLPSDTSSTGHFTLGGRIPSTAKFTPLTQDNLFYSLEITGISVGGQDLAVDASVFRTGGAIIDSGTVITWLPPTAYSKLSSAFQNMMKDYTRTSGVTLLDTCYDFSNLEEVSIPLISFTFSGGVEVDIDVSGIMYPVGGLARVCLAFTGNSDDSDVAIFGNTQQKTYEIVHDGARGRLGFVPGGCK